MNSLNHDNRGGHHPETMYTYLATYGGHGGPAAKKLIRLSLKSEVIREAEKAFNLPANTSLRVQLYVEEFDDFIDVDHLADLPDRGKLKILPKQQR